MPLENVCVKKEPQWDEESDESGEPSRKALYSKQELKQELAIGPEIHQRQDVTYIIEGNFVIYETKPFSRFSLTLGFYSDHYFFKLLLLLLIN